MNRFVFTYLPLALLTGLLAKPIVAQTAPAAVGVQSSAADNEESNDSKYTQAQVDPDQQPTAYVPSLDGTGLIALNSTIRSRLLVGANYSGGWDSNPDDLTNGDSSGAFIFSPYIGAVINTNRTQYLFQYQPTLRRYTSDQYDGGTLHLASASIMGNISERWRWNFKATGSHGQDSIRLVAPGQSEAVGDVAGIGSGSASFLPNAGVVTYISGEASMQYDFSRRNSLAIKASNAYSSYTGFQQTSSIATVGLNYQRAMTPILSLLAYDQTSYYYGAIHCGSFGFGGGLRWKARENTFLSLTGGPQINASSCGKQQGFAYTAGFNTRISGNAQIYATAERQMTTTYLGPGLWQQNYSAGYQRELTPSRTIGFDIGYVNSDALTTASSYHGTFFGGIYSHRLGHGFNTSFSYRNYSGAWGDANYSRHVALFILSWTPGVGHLFQ